MIRKFLNQQGFSIVQAMIFAGIMAAGALVMTRAITDLKLTQKGAEARDDLETFHATIVSALQDSSHCTATHTYNMTNPAEKQILLASGEVLAQENQIYMNNTIKVTRISANEAPSPAGTISISYAKLKAEDRLKQGYGGKDIKKIVPVNFITKDGVFSRCYLDEKSYNSQTAEEFCTSLGNFMQWDTATKKCVLKSHNCSSQSGTVFAGIDSNGQEICQKITDAIVTKDLFGIGTVNCPARTNLGLTVMGSQIVILCNPGGCMPTTSCADLLPTDCPAAPNLSNSCGVDCGLGTKSSGCAATLAWTPLTHDFGNITVGGSSPGQTFTLTNSDVISTSGCTAPSITDTTNFTLTPSGNCVGTADVPAGGNCTVVITANPTTSGSKTTTLTRACTVGGTASTTANMIVVNGSAAAAGACQGWGTDNTTLWSNGTDTAGTCTTPYHYQDFIVSTTNFKTGNIYSITRGQTVTEEALATDTPQTMLNRLASRINGANIIATGACSTSSYNNATVISSTTIRHRVQFQHTAVTGASRSCNIPDETTCTATVGCSWNTTSPNVCKGWNYTVPQGICNGTYTTMGCGYDGFTSGGSISNCQYSFPDQTSCQSGAAMSMGCYWGSVSQTCYASDSASCTALGGGCSWQSYPSQHRSCTSITDQTTCQANGPNCTWGPP